jgi:hypothetical protein
LRRVVNRRRVGTRPAAGLSPEGIEPPGHASRTMGRLTLWLVIIVVLLLLGGAVFLALWNPPAPSTPVEKVLPNERFPK